jgi:hypothetical protein
MRVGTVRSLRKDDLHPGTYEFTDRNKRDYRAVVTVTGWCELTRTR